MLIKGASAAPTVPGQNLPNEGRQRRQCRTRTAVRGRGGRMSGNGKTLARYARYEHISPIRAHRCVHNEISLLRAPFDCWHWEQFAP